MKAFELHYLLTYILNTNIVNNIKITHFLFLGKIKALYLVSNYVLRISLVLYSRLLPDYSKFNNYKTFTL